jgi:hypothetical protein
VTPSNRQWRENECLTDSEPGLKRPTDVLAQVRNALSENGFGVITEIDLAGLHDKIGAEIPAGWAGRVSRDSGGTGVAYSALQRCGARMGRGQSSR